MRTTISRVTPLLSAFLLTISAGVQWQNDAKATVVQQKEVVKNFNKQVKGYVEQRNAVKKKIPALPKEAKPEQITAYQAAFVAAMRTARVNAKQGDLFDPEIASHIRTLINQEFKGLEKAELKKTVLEADTKGVLVRVNYPYPDEKEFTQIPPTLLLKLPQLPKELKYRFVNRYLLLVDTDNDLIVDYMPRALS
jgi:hypothetical protein